MVTSQWAIDGTDKSSKEKLISQSRGILMHTHQFQTGDSHTAAHYAKEKSVDGTKCQIR